MKLPSLFLVLCLCFTMTMSAQKKSLVTKTVSYPSGNDTVQAYLCLPDTTGPFPGVILIHEWWGLTDWMKENAKSFAVRGYATMAIDLYRGKVTTMPDEAGQLMKTLPQDRALQDLKAAFQYMQSRPEVKPAKIGAIGWCMGGGYSLISAVNIPELAFCVVCYGHLPTDSSSIASIHCPVLGIFGDADKVITPADVGQFTNATHAMGKKVWTKIYPNAQHAFMNPGNETGYANNAAEDAWSRIFTFVDTTTAK